MAGQSEATRQFGKPIITLENCILPEEKLSPTPSMTDGLDWETELDLRILGCELIQLAGIHLKLPQVAMATGQVLFQRFYYSKSFVKLNMEHLAMACINLASKIEEAPRRVRDVINVFHHIKQKRNNEPIAPLVLDQNYTNLKTQVIKAERRVLKELGFCVHIKHPHKMIVTYLQILKKERNLQLVKTAWNYMNDSLRTDVFVRFPPETIACACIFLTARQLNIKLPDKPAWYLLFGATQNDLEDISLTILRLYARPRRSLEELEKDVERCQQVLQEAKLKAKEGTAEDATKPATTPGFATPSSRQNSPGGNKASPQSLVNSVLKKKASSGKDQPAPSSSDGKRVQEKNGRHNSRSRSRSSRSRSSSRSHSFSPPPPPSSSSSLNRYAGRPHHKQHSGDARKRRRSRSYSYSRSRTRSRSPARNYRKHRHRHPDGGGSSPHWSRSSKHRGERSPRDRPSSTGHKSKRERAHRDDRRYRR